MKYSDNKKFVNKDEVKEADEKVAHFNITRGDEDGNEINDEVATERQVDLRESGDCVNVSTQTCMITVAAEAAESEGDEADDMITSDGEWTDFHHGDVLKVGDVVKLPGACKSVNPPIQLEKGLRGIVQAINADGDPMLYLPDARRMSHGRHWVDRDQFKKLPVIRKYEKG